MEEIKGCKVTIENDGRCATWAELGFGNLIHSKNALVVVLGTYIGMGIVIDHKVYEGSHFWQVNIQMRIWIQKRLSRIPWLHALEKMVLKE